MTCPQGSANVFDEPDSLHDLSISRVSNDMSIHLY